MHEKRNEPRGKSATPYLQEGTFLGRHKSFTVEKMLGGGGFGQIYRVSSSEVQEELAVKVEKFSKDSARIVLEAKVLDLMCGAAHFPKIYYIGTQKGCNFIVMQKLGMNITDLRKQTKEQRFSTMTTIRLGIQMVEAIEALHQKGYLHRDIKPTNMCMGVNSERKKLFLIDFGMARCFVNENGSLRKARRYCGFRGTHRYCSINVHDRVEQTRIDDLWSVYYSLIEIGEGSLPWKSIENADEVGQIKKKLGHWELSRKLPSRFERFHRHLSSLSGNDYPDYEVLIAVLTKCCKYVDKEAEFEWDEWDYEKYY